MTTPPQNGLLMSGLARGWLGLRRRWSGARRLKPSSATPVTPVSYAGVAARSTVGAGAPGVGVAPAVGRVAR